MIRALDGHRPEIGPGAFVHEAAEVIGRVRLGSRCSIWPRAVLRADLEEIAVGEEANVQDGAVLHADPGRPCRVGARVSIGHLACVHGCTLGDEVTVGMGAVVMDGARVGAGAVLGAGAVVLEDAEIPPGALAVGVPARVVRTGGEKAQRATARRRAERYVALIGVHGGL